MSGEENLIYLMPFLLFLLLIYMMSKAKGLKAEIIGRDGIRKRYGVPKGKKHFLVNKIGYKVDARAVITDLFFGLPIRRRIMYREGQTSPIQPFSNPGEKEAPGEVVGAILRTKVLEDIGKVARGPFPFKWLVYIGIGIAAIYFIITFVGPHFGVTP